MGLSCGPNMPSIMPNLRAEQQRQPVEQPEDLYKFIHQAALGNAHMLEHGDAKLYLLQEWDEVQPDPDEQMLVDLSPSGKVVRLNLRPFKARGGDPQDLWAAMERSAAASYDGTAVLEYWWQEAIELSAEGELPFNPEVLKDYISQRRTEGFPAVHHSPSYEARYQPSYRVLLREEAEKLGL